MLENANSESKPDAQPASRRYHFSVRVPSEMLRGAATHFMWRKLKLRYILGWAGAGLGYAVWSTTTLGLLSDAVGVLTLLLVLVLVVLPIALWIAVRRTVEGYGKLTAGQPVEYEVDDEWLISRYANGAGELRWSAFKEVIKTDEVWLLAMDAEDRFIPLPIEQVPEDVLLFIEAEIAAHGAD